MYRVAPPQDTYGELSGGAEEPDLMSMTAPAAIGQSHAQTESPKKKQPLSKTVGAGDEPMSSEQVHNPSVAHTHNLAD